MLIAPAYTDDALAVIAQKKNVRVLEVALPPAVPARRSCDLKRVGGGLLVQTADARNVAAAGAQGRHASARRRRRSSRDLLFAWRVAKFVKSNAIVYCRDGRTLGIGAGQMSRVDSTRIAAIKAQERGPVARRVRSSPRMRSFRFATASTSSPTTAQSP